MACSLQQNANQSILAAIMIEPRCPPWIRKWYTFRFTYMKPLFTIFSSIFLLSTTHGQDIVSLKNTDSLCRLIDSLCKYPVFEDSDTIRCYDCQRGPVEIHVTYFTYGEAEQPVVKAAEHSIYFPAGKTINNYDTDSTVTNCYYFMNQQLIKVTSTTSIRNKNSQIQASYFSRNDYNDWIRKGKPGPALNKRESFIWAADFLMSRFKKSE